MTLLSNGMVLVAGGFDGYYLATSELYNPTTGPWTVTGSLNDPRRFLTATHLNNVAGGWNRRVTPSYLNSAELFTNG